MPLFNTAKAGILAGTIDLTNDTIKCVLMTSAYTFNADTDFIDAGGASDIVDARVQGTTDITLTSKTITTDDTNDRATFDAADPTFAAGTATENAEQFVIYKDTGVATTSIPIYQGTFTATPTNGIAITINFHTNGIFALS
jgi:hypothetical protein